MTSSLSSADDQTMIKGFVTPSIYSSMEGDGWRKGCLSPADRLRLAGAGADSGIGSAGSGASPSNKQYRLSTSDDDSGCALEEYTWVPPGLRPAQVHRYFCSLPEDKVPLINSAGEKWRVRQLLYQLPPQDQEARYCRNLNEHERKELRLFAQQRKHEALGRGTAALVNEKLDGTPCVQCSEPVYAGDLGISAARAGEGAIWHPACFSCTLCLELLVDMIYFCREGKLYCGRHHAEKIKPRCGACDEIIFSDECTEAQGRSWHLNHFACLECETPLGGQRYVIRDSRAFCLACFDELYAETCAACQSVIPVDESHMSHGDQRWHASESCFACYVCREALLARPYLPYRGALFCSLDCCKLAKRVVRATKQQQQQQQLIDSSVSSITTGADSSSRSFSCLSHGGGLLNKNFAGSHPTCGSNTSGFSSRKKQQMPPGRRNQMSSSLIQHPTSTPPTRRRIPSGDSDYEPILDYLRRDWSTPPARSKLSHHHHGASLANQQSVTPNFPRRAANHPPVQTKLQSEDPMGIDMQSPPPSWQQGQSSKSSTRVHSLPDLVQLVDSRLSESETFKGNCPTCQIDEHSITSNQKLSPPAHTCAKSNLPVLENADISSSSSSSVKPMPNYSGLDSRPHYENSKFIKSLLTNHHDRVPNPPSQYLSRHAKSQKAYVPTACVDQRQLPSAVKIPNQQTVVSSSSPTPPGPDVDFPPEITVNVELHSPPALPPQRLRCHAATASDASQECSVPDSMTHRQVRQVGSGSESSSANSRGNNKKEGSSEAGSYQKACRDGNLISSSIDTLESGFGFGWDAEVNGRLKKLAFEDEDGYSDDEGDQTTTESDDHFAGTSPSYYPANNRGRPSHRSQHKCHYNSSLSHVTIPQHPPTAPPPKSCLKSQQEHYHQCNPPSGESSSTNYEQPSNPPVPPAVLRGHQLGSRPPAMTSTLVTPDQLLARFAVQQDLDSCSTCSSSSDDDDYDEDCFSYNYYNHNTTLPHATRLNYGGYGSTGTPGARNTGGHTAGVSGAAYNNSPKNCGGGGGQINGVQNGVKGKRRGANCIVS